MALNFPDPSASPWEDPNEQVWKHNGDAWIRLYDTAGELPSNTGGLKNPIINGLFYIWQRGAAEVFTGTKYCADRWITRDAANGSVTTQRRDVPASFGKEISYVKYCAAINIQNLSSAANEVVAISQKIEGVHIFAGQEVTLSWHAKTDSGAGYLMGIHVDQNFGTGGSVSVQCNNTTQEITNTWTKYSVTFTLPHVDTKTIGVDDYIGIHFWLSGGTDHAALHGGIGNQAYELLLTGVQLEKGAQATGFELRSWGTEVAMCQRYFTKSYDLDTTPGETVNKNGAFTYIASKDDSNLWGTGLQFSVYMREVPDVTLYAPSTGTAGKINYIGGAEVAGTSIAPLVSEGGIDYVAAGATILDQEAITYHYVADAEMGATIPL